MSSSADSSLLVIEEISWAFLVIHQRCCGSFSAWDWNACFSLIFEKRRFGCLNEEEESLFMTLRTFDSLCRSCSNFVTLNSNYIPLTVVTAHGLNQLDLDNNYVACFCYWNAYKSRKVKLCQLWYSNYWACFKEPCY